MPAAALDAGRRLARLGWCYVVPGVWACAWAWALVLQSGPEVVAAIRQPGHLVIWLFAGIWLLALALLAGGATAGLVGAVMLHRRLGLAVAARRPGAATRAFVLVALQLGCWFLLAWLVTMPAAATTGAREFRLPAAPGGWVPLLMLGLSALLLLPLSRARALPAPAPARRPPPLARPALPPLALRVAPPPLPRRVLPL